jgi:hypothetical protein
MIKNAGLKDAGMPFFMTYYLNKLYILINRLNMNKHGVCCIKIFIYLHHCNISQPMWIVVMLTTYLSDGKFRLDGLELLV